MPILAPELSLYPADLFDRAEAATDPDAHWWALYSMPRQEKQLMRRLALATPFYSPVVANAAGPRQVGCACRTFRCLLATCSCTELAHSGIRR